MSVALFTRSADFSGRWGACEGGKGSPVSAALLLLEGFAEGCCNACGEDLSDMIRLFFDGAERESS